MVMVFGHEEKDSNAVTFLERNFATENPDLWITQDMTTRVMENDRVMENHEGSFKPLPDFDLYAAGFPMVKACMLMVVHHVSHVS